MRIQHQLDRIVLVNLQKILQCVSLASLELNRKQIKYYYSGPFSHYFNFYLLHLEYRDTPSVNQLDVRKSIPGQCGYNQWLFDPQLLPQQTSKVNLERENLIKPKIQKELSTLTGLNTIFAKQIGLHKIFRFVNLSN